MSQATTRTTWHDAGAAGTAPAVRGGHPRRAAGSQRAPAGLRAEQRRAGPPGRRACGPAGPARELPLVIGGRERAHRTPASRRDAPPARACAGRCASGRVRTKSSRAIAAARAPSRTGPRCPGTRARPSSCAPPSCSRRTVARAAQRGHDARPVARPCDQAEIDAACELVDFWRFNVPFAEQLCRAADLDAPGCGTSSTTPARGLRLRDHAVQLHRHRRQPADRARAAWATPSCGSRRRPRCSRRQIVIQLLREAGPAGRRDQLRPGYRPQRSRRASASPRPGRRALHRLDRRCSARSGRPSARTSPATATTRASSARPAARTSSSRTRRADARRRGDRHRPRRLRVPGPEVLGRLPHLRPALGVGPSCRSRWSRDRRSDQVGDVSDFRTSWARSSTQPRVRPARGRDRRGQGVAAMKLVAGGECDDKVGWFVRPTLIQTDDPRTPMRDEFFGPIVTLHVYDDAAWRDPRARRSHQRLRAHRRGVRRDRAAIVEAGRGCATPRATSTSTTSPPARSSASSRSVARAPRARTTRPARLNLLGFVRAPSRRRSSPRAAGPARPAAEGQRDGATSRQVRRRRRGRPRAGASRRSCRSEARHLVGGARRAGAPTISTPKPSVSAASLPARTALRVDRRRASPSGHAAPRRSAPHAAPRTSRSARDIHAPLALGECAPRLRNSGRIRNWRQGVALEVARRQQDDRLERRARCPRRRWLTGA